MENLSKVWINGSFNQKTSNIVDQASSEQHHAAMLQVRADTGKASNQPLTTYSPIARNLLMLDRAMQAHMKRMFDIYYVMAKESLSFCKYPVSHELEERHGVDLGFAYKTEVSAQTLTSLRVSTKASLIRFPNRVITVFSWMNRLIQVMWKMNWCWSSTASRMKNHVPGISHWRFQ